jgi:uncharacterized protein (DUF362 family)
MIRISGRPFPSLVISLQEPRPNAVVASGTNDDSPAAILKAALDGLGGIGRFVKPGQVVAIKPNATWAYPAGTASSTDPELLRALILMVREAGARRVIVMDHCTLDSGTEACLRVSGIGPVLDKLAVETVFPDRQLSPKDVYLTISLPQSRAFSRLGVIRAAVAADVRINLAVAKSHLVTRYTMCLKNMMGFLEAPAGLHADLDRGIADINTPSAIQAQLHILEAIRVRLPVGRRQAGGNETEISHPEKIKRRNEIVAGTDPVLVDSYGCVRYFGFKPRELAHLASAFAAGLGEIDPERAGREGRLRIQEMRGHITYLYSKEDRYVMCPRIFL